MKDWVIAIICIVGTIGAWAIMSPDADATPVCAVRHDIPPSDVDCHITDDGRKCMCHIKSSSVDRTDLQVIAIGAVVMAIIHELINSDDGNGIKDFESSLIIKSNPDGIRVEYAIPFE